MKFYISGGNLVFGEVPSPFELSEEERRSVEMVISALIGEVKEGCDFSFERTKEYLKISFGYVCFCHLKVKGRTPYIELSISERDYQNISSDPKYSSVPPVTKRFTRIPLKNVDDISHFSELIVLAFRWATCTS